jgi:hypothetical protein
MIVVFQLVVKAVGTVEAEVAFALSEKEAGP